MAFIKATTVFLVAVIATVNGAVLNTTAAADICYGSGGWAPISEGLDVIENFCNDMPSASSSCYNIRDYHWDMQGCPRIVGVDECISVLSTVIEGCQGRHQDTQGGRLYAFGCYWNIDPNSGGC